MVEEQAFVHLIMVQEILLQLVRLKEWMVDQLVAHHKEVVVEVEKQVSTKSVCSEHARASACGTSPWETLTRQPWHFCAGGRQGDGVRGQAV